MRKSLAFIALFCAGAVSANPDPIWQIQVTNNAGRTVNVPIMGERVCICLKHTQTSKIKNTKGGVMRLFGSDDCTGNFVGLALGATRTGAHWVNSASVGRDGIPSAGPFSCTDQIG
ncbi:hypothetical protein BG004_000278 [Podila humilis]|nr:hypothetical protein BG004_000278 [Podila humilis]